MCLAIPAKIISLIAPDRAKVSVGNVQKEISLSLIDDAQVGDYVIMHVGFALSKLNEKEAQKTLQLLRDVT